MYKHSIMTNRLSIFLTTCWYIPTFFSFFAFLLIVFTFSPLPLSFSAPCILLQSSLHWFALHGKVLLIRLHVLAYCYWRTPLGSYTTAHTLSLTSPVSFLSLLCLFLLLFFSVPTNLPPFPSLSFPFPHSTLFTFFSSTFPSLPHIPTFSLSLSFHCHSLSLSFSISISRLELLVFSLERNCIDFPLSLEDICFHVPFLSHCFGNKGYRLWEAYVSNQ